jgi:RNA polymerase sigma-70 factor (ECF subfamily)
LKTNPEPNGQPEDMNELSTASPPTLAEVYRDHLGDVLSWLRLAGVPENEREDAAHEVFVALHGALPSYDPRRPLKPWLKAITVRTGWHHRGRARGGREALVDAITAVDDAPSSEERLSEEQRAKAVREVLAGVDEVLALHELDGIAMEEIAQQLEVPVNTLYSRRRRAIAAFKSTWKRIRGDRFGAAVVPLGLVEALGSQRGAPPDEGADPVSDELRERLWRRVESTLHLAPPVAPQAPSAPTGGPPVTPPLQASTALAGSRAVVTALTFALGVGSGAALHAGVAGTASSAEAPSAARSSRDTAIHATVSPSIAAPNEAPSPPIRKGDEALPEPSSARHLATTTAPLRPNDLSPTGPDGARTAAPAESAAPRASAGGTDEESASLARETQLLRTARMALVRGDVEAARESLLRHLQEFPRGAMAQDRNALLSKLPPPAVTPP